MKENITILDKQFRILITQNQIRTKVLELANRINTDYAVKKPIFLVVLRGAMFFATDLMREINLGCTMSIISAKSYLGGLKSTGNVEIEYFDTDFAGKDVIIVEDIVETGLTIDSLTKELWQKKPNSLEVVTFLSKPNARIKQVDVKYIGFEISDLFVIGYGMDYCQYGRELKDIYVIDEGKI